MKFLLILISSIVVLMTIGTIIVGSKSFDGIVVDKPYETGLNWDKMQSENTRLGWNVTINKENYRIGKNDIGISLRDRTGRSLPRGVVTVKLTRPETTRYDKTYSTQPGQNGDFLASLDLPIYGNWDLVISAKNGVEESVFRRSIFAENK